jgi:hypothetical protein
MILISLWLHQKGIQTTQAPIIKPQRREVIQRDRGHIKLEMEKRAPNDTVATQAKVTMPLRLPVRMVLTLIGTVNGLPKPTLPQRILLPRGLRQNMLEKL